MTVEIRCYTTLREKLPAEAERGVLNYQLKGEKTIKDLIESLNLPYEELHLIIVNGKQADLDKEIKDGDRIGFFPPVGGG